MAPAGSAAGGVLSWTPRPGARTPRSRRGRSALWQSTVAAAGLGRVLGSVLPAWQGWHRGGGAVGRGDPTAGGGRMSTRSVARMTGSRWPLVRTNREPRDAQRWGPVLSRGRRGSRGLTEWGKQNPRVRDRTQVRQERGLDPIEDSAPRPHAHLCLVQAPLPVGQEQHVPLAPRMSHRGWSQPLTTAAFGD